MAGLVSNISPDDIGNSMMVVPEVFIFWRALQGDTYSQFRMLFEGVPIYLFCYFNRNSE